MYIFRSVHSLWHSARFDALHSLLCGMPQHINGNDGWRRARGQHRNMPTQADGECCVRSCCLFARYKEYFYRETITPSLQVLHIQCLFGQYGSRRERKRSNQKVNELVQRKQRHAYVDLKMISKNHIFGKK